MSALLQTPLPAARRLSAMRTTDLDAVMDLERMAYAAPWTRGNFIDSLASGYPSQCLFDPTDRMLGYCVAMQGAGEVHLLNLTVGPAFQGRGHARYLLDALVASARQSGMARLWLEVREGNLRARELYRRYGLLEIGRRKGYYPTAPDRPQVQREDALLMSLPLDEGPP